MNPSPSISYELAQSRITDLRRQARRESAARTALAHTTQAPTQPPTQQAAQPPAQESAQPRKPRVTRRLRLHLRDA